MFTIQTSRFFYLLSFIHIPSCEPSLAFPFIFSLLSFPFYLFPFIFYLLPFTLLNLARQQINHCHSYSYPIFYLL